MNTLAIRTMARKKANLMRGSGRNVSDIPNFLLENRNRALRKLGYRNLPYNRTLPGVPSFDDTGLGAMNAVSGPANTLRNFWGGLTTTLSDVTGFLTSQELAKQKAAEASIANTNANILARLQNSRYTTYALVGGGLFFTYMLLKRKRRA